ncbi:hypothetical protein ACIQU3_14230 [Streptomyces sp. NPDC101110]|uniref:hypothetical protein n=1 Tax=Streptomyces sp. NPDC101110 TaxID=3366104 RepID=UPI00381A4A4E
MSYTPLHDPARAISEPAHLDVEIAVTRQILDETAGLNIHSDDDMRSAAFALDCRVRALLAAIEAARGERQ